MRIVFKQSKLFTTTRTTHLFIGLSAALQSINPNHWLVDTLGQVSTGHSTALVFRCTHSFRDSVVSLALHAIETCNRTASLSSIDPTRCELFTTLFNTAGGGSDQSTTALSAGRSLKDATMCRHFGGNLPTRDSTAGRDPGACWECLHHSNVQTPLASHGYAINTDLSVNTMEKLHSIEVMSNSSD